MPTLPSQRAQDLTTADFAHYLRYEVMLSYYKEIKKAGSLVNSVDNFWNNLLPLIFKLVDNFGVEQESRVLEDQGVLLRADFMIRYIKNGDAKKVILVEDKRAGGGASAKIWGDALQQVINYAKSVRQEAGQDPNAALYLLVNIGTYVRFYQLDGGANVAQVNIGTYVRFNQLDGGANVAQDWAPGKGLSYELADDEAQIWELLQHLRTLGL